MTESTPSDHDRQNDPPTNLQDAIRARALRTLERDRSVRRRSPKQIAVVVALMVIAVCGFLFAADVTFRTMHRIVEIWMQIRSQAQQPDVKQPYSVTYIPITPPEQNASSSNSSASSASQH